MCQSESSISQDLKHLVSVVIMDFSHVCSKLLYCNVSVVTRPYIMDFSIVCTVGNKKQREKG